MPVCSSIKGKYGKLTAPLKMNKETLRQASRTISSETENTKIIFTETTEAKQKMCVFRVTLPYLILLVKLAIAFMFSLSQKKKKKKKKSKNICAIIFKLNIQTNRLSKQCRPRLNCSYRSSLIRLYTVCHSINTF